MSVNLWSHSAIVLGVTSNLAIVLGATSNLEDVGKIVVIVGRFVVICCLVMDTLKICCHLLSLRGNLKP
jgi:hypothetical protein